MCPKCKSAEKTAQVSNGMVVTKCAKCGTVIKVRHLPKK